MYQEVCSLSEFHSLCLGWHIALDILKQYLTVSQAGTRVIHGNVTVLCLKFVFDNYFFL